MKARIYFVDSVEVELPPHIADLVTVKDGVVVGKTGQMEMAFDMALLSLATASRPDLVGKEPASASMVCRECGCTDEDACLGGCYWVEVDLCSSCSGGTA